MNLISCFKKLRVFSQVQDRPTSKTGLECSSDSNTALIAVIAIAIVVIIVLGIVVAILWKELKRSVKSQLYPSPYNKSSTQWRSQPDFLLLLCKFQLLR